MDNLLNYIPPLLEGLWLSLGLWLCTVACAVPIAVLMAVGKTSGPKPLKGFLGFYTWFFRGTPLLLQLFFVYYALPFVGFALSAFAACWFTFALNSAAYHCEIFRAGIQSIEDGQYEAAMVLGLSRAQTILRVILPQMAKRSLPAVCNEFIIVFKDTALIAGVAMGDLLLKANEIVSREFVITPYFIVFAIYLLFAWLVIRGFRIFEKKLAVMD